MADQYQLIGSMQINTDQYQSIPINDGSIGPFLLSTSIDPLLIWYSFIHQINKGSISDQYRSIVPLHFAIDLH